MAGFRLIVQDILWFRGVAQFGDYARMGQSNHDRRRTRVTVLDGGSVSL